MSNPLFNKKNILIIGGAGFIGSHLCDRLVKENQVICLDNFISGHEANIDHLLRHPNFKFIKHDIIDPIDLEKMSELKGFKVEFQGIQEIYNLAAPTSPKHFKKTQIQTLLTNSQGTINGLELAKKYQAKFLHFSSVVIYGPRRHDNPYFQEKEWGSVDLLSPRSCYDEGKRFAESAVMTYSQVYNLDAKIIRVFRTFGPRMKLREGHMIPDFIIDAIDNKDLTIYGDKNFATSLCYVDDVIDGALKVMDSPEKGPFNLGDPRETYLTEVAEKIISMINSNSKIIFKDSLLFMTPLGLPNIDQVKEKIGWLPIVRLEDGLAKTIEYTKANKDLLRLRVNEEEKNNLEESIEQL